ncbi:MAG: hypothetical protein GXO87_10290 [Chlorobi bacterium]|nr:hypothetical protein [Chlorobiota bacterium]
MNIKNMVLILSLAAFAAACSSGFSITRSNDKTNPDEEILYSTPIKMVGDRLSDYYKTYVQFYCHKTAKKDKYYFKITYEGKRLILLNKMELIIRYDKAIYEPDRIPIYKKNGVLGMKEDLVFAVPREKVEEIIENRECDMNLYGKNLDIKIPWRQEWIDNLTKFFIEVNKS